MKKTLLCVITCFAFSSNAELPKDAESVMNINADQAAWLLSDETVTVVSAKQASQLLGDTDDFALKLLNNLPATAAGNDSIVFINSDSAESLLGDEPSH